MHKLELELPSTANATGGRPMEKVIVRTENKNFVHMLKSVKKTVCDVINNGNGVHGPVRVRQEVHLPTEVSQ